MSVNIVNDGPVTLDIESPDIPPPKQRKPPGSKKVSSDELETPNET
jgi:hypothetical protein